MNGFSIVDELEMKTKEWKKKWNEHFRFRESSIENNIREYEGKTLDGKPNGQGVIKFSDGTFYKGSFRNGEFWDVSWYDKDGNRSVFDFGLKYDKNFPTDFILS